MKIKLYYSVLLAVFILSGCTADKGFVYSHDRVNSYRTSGYSHYVEENYEQALADFNKAIKINPINYDAYFHRAELYKQQKEYDLALADFNKAIELNPYPPYYLGRGSVYYMKKQYDLAIKEYIKAIRLGNYPPAYHDLAWLLATCSDEKYRDGSKAVAFAEKAVGFGKRAGYHIVLEPQVLNTLAAAYAEAGDFDMAVKSQEKAIQLLKTEGNLEHLDGFENRLESYKKNISWTDIF